VKSQGDGFMVAFASARRAVDCARGINREIDAQLGTHPDGPIRLRIGLHTGEAIKEETDFYGKNVVVAARILVDPRNPNDLVAVSAVQDQFDISAAERDFGYRPSISVADGIKEFA